MKLVQAVVQALDDLFVATMTVGATVGFFVGYFWLSDRFGPLWPSATVLIGYAAFIVYRIYKPRKKVKRNDSRTEAVPSSGNGGTSSVVKLNDLTVSRAIQESRARYADVPPDGYKGPR